MISINYTGIKYVFFSFFICVEKLFRSSLCYGHFHSLPTIIQSEVTIPFTTSTVICSNIDKILSISHSIFRLSIIRVYFRHLFLRNSFLYFSFFNISIHRYFYFRSVSFLHFSFDFSIFDQFSFCFFSFYIFPFAIYFFDFFTFDVT